eukprot:794129-Pyramimonas_sp.AAC.1
MGRTSSSLSCWFSGQALLCPDGMGYGSNDAHSTHHQRAPLWQATTGLGPKMPFENPSCHHAGSTTSGEKPCPQRTGPKDQVPTLLRKTPGRRHGVAPTRNRRL